MISLPAAALFAGILGLVAGIRPGAAQERPSEEALRAIEAAGRRIAGYHEAVARARERFQKQAPDMAPSTRFVVVDRHGAWRVIVMRPVEGEAGAKGWQMQAEIGFNPKAGEVTTIERFNPPRQAPSDALGVQHAIEAASAIISLHVAEAKAPFQEAAFKEPDKTFVVYLQPATERSTAARFGSDLLANVSGDGMKVLKARAMHRAAAWVPVPSSATGEPTLHSHIEGEMPTETDLAVVIEHPGLAPHLVLTPRHMFRIDEAGVITYLGPNQVPPASPGGAR